MSRLVYDAEVTMLWQSNLIEQEKSLDALFHAIKAWDFLMEQKRLTHAVLKTTHSLLMDSDELYSVLDQKYRGEYRDIPVYIGDRRAPEPISIRPSLDALFVKMNDTRNVPVSDEARELHAQALHVEYERIHPFVDGNGRTGRMLYNWHLLKLRLPVHVINADDRYEYYKWFDDEGDF